MASASTAACGAAPANPGAAEGAAGGVSADPFARQRAVEGWDQTKLAAQRVLVLGVGGIGSACALSLCRLGVQRMVLLDMDSVDTTNLNRQVGWGWA